MNYTCVFNQKVITIWQMFLIQSSKLLLKKPAIILVLKG